MSSDELILCVCVLVAQSCLTLCDPMDCSPQGSFVHRILQARILEWVAVPFSSGSSQPTDQTHPGLPHCRWILYQLRHQGSPRILEWVAYPFSRGLSQPRNQTRVSWIAGGLFTSWDTRESPQGNRLAERQDAEARNRTLIGKPAEQDGRKLSENNHLIGGLEARFFL